MSYEMPNITKKSEARMTVFVALITLLLLGYLGVKIYERKTAPVDSAVGQSLKTKLSSFSSGFKK
ncbi:hypothetical protein RYZ26_01480 [Terasakiella sp. A23]|uniref:hypothetical protein n=1 Tax=Terasakiella sp. FCG-A23 TaxID=3080561 RepID=UPI00295393DB|nr:hypothetical protein [Terasakiella sp. A23]MDV7338247.1 hypothetical protein [Terasakiella sp. A23]